MKKQNMSNKSQRRKIVPSVVKPICAGHSVRDSCVSDELALYDFSDDASNESADELIDTCEYTKDTRELIISAEAVEDIVMNKNEYDLKHKNLIDAFRYLRTNKLSEFRKLFGTDRSMINTKYDKTYLLHEACRIGNPDFVSILLFLGGNCNILDDNGMMAQHYAVKSKSTVIIDILSLFGNNMNVCDARGNTPFYYACLDKNEEMINTLMLYKANSLMETPIMLTDDQRLMELLNGYIDDGY